MHGCFKQNKFNVNSKRIKMENKTKNLRNSEQKQTGQKNKISNKNSDIKNNELIAIIRISGMVKVNKYIEDTLYRLKLRRKYSCVLIKPTKENLGMLKKVKFYVAYGPINKETLVKLIKERGQMIDKTKEIDAEKIVGELFNGRNLKDSCLKPFFRLHPPRKGIKSKLQYPKGVLGNNKEDINKLIDRML